ncbi:rod shape-determining protein MreC [Sporolactobacillus sp. THM19-2]|jgi:rod shape-determining protein MreC|uniref:rod shape-determining protein MreC n=1 Tax=Sporolactobacillus sp. THM19-2 TaxID=2511171 RepID=UPI00101FCB38|nr:rod shape-determining protein MreC [Sporolactobacillus sp. THM19-2]RYL94683.1 rod shape-determining protein MreC [Sporolactobacillus sp. THM19-2]
MPSFFSNKKLIVLLTSLIVLIALISYSLRQGSRTTWMERFVQDSAGFFQYVINVPAQYAAGFFENVSDMNHTYQENKRLKAKLEDYARLQQENRDLTQRFNELKKQLNVDKNPDLSSYTKYTAQVIARPNDGWNQMLTVDKGRMNGIRTGMPVVTPEGLIGTIEKTGNFTSRVSLITNKRNVNQISAKISNTGTYGMIEGFDEEKGALLFQRIPIKSNVKKGQTVVTSGLSGMYPQGLIIGKITSVSTDQYGLTRAAEVKPSANFDSINYVMIVNREAPTPDTGK